MNKTTHLNFLKFPTMIPLDSDLLNSPERILAELVKTKQKQNELKSLEAVLKDELEQHLKDGRIKGIYKANGVTANRLQTKQKYQEMLLGRQG